MENKEIKEEEKEQEQEKKETNATHKINVFLKKVPYKPIIVLIFLLVIALIIPRKLPKFFEEDNYPKIEKISNLATLEVYSHDVAYRENPRTPIIGIIGNIGYYKYWLEYDSIIKVGIDAKKVKITPPNIFNEVKVYIPEAEVIGEPMEIEEYIGVPVTETGFLTSISAEEKASALGKSKEDLKNAVSQDQDLLNQARDRAKELFKNYIISIGKEIGVNYKVVFED